MDVRASDSGGIGSGGIGDRDGSRVESLASLIAGRGVGEGGPQGVRAGGVGDEAVIARIGVGLGGVLRLIETEARQVRVKAGEDSPARLLTDLISRSERESGVRERQESEREALRESARERAERLLADGRVAREAVEPRERVRAARSDERPVLRLADDERGGASGRVDGADGDGDRGVSDGVARVVVAAENASASASAARVFEAEERSSSELVRAEVVAASDRASEALGPFETGRLVELLG